MGLPRRTVLVSLLSSGAFAGAWAAAATPSTPDPQALLSASDHAFGGGLAGVAWDVRVTSDKAAAGADEDTVVLLRVKARDGASSAEIVEPLRSKGLRVLQVQRNMWISKPGMKKPVAISPRQRLSGQAALGDIASTGYARDYRAAYLRREDLDGEACHVLDLSAGSTQTTYDRITYWVSEARGLGVRADFLSVSGKLLKRAGFRYDGKVMHDGRALPFVSRMTIKDMLTGEQTVLEYSHVQVQAIPSSDFDIGIFQ